MPARPGPSSTAPPDCRGPRQGPSCSSVSAHVEGLVIQPDGRILVGGSAAATEFLVDSSFLVGRYLENGTPDPGFGTDGFTLTPTGTAGGDNEIYDIALAGHDGLIAAGECDRTTTGRDVCLARYRLD
ncbi:delta-60 repeat domain-containing protein [Kitasatospora sp. NBC_00085]|uniref:delta-60 repeat domain-containing protein n=1 Tax=unclassified Kitasatospora TaxID=2633591 RepID=UPI002F915773